MNRAHLFVSVLFLGVAACGPDLQASCEDYNAAYIECINQAYPDDATTAETLTAALEGTCDVYADTSGDAAKAAADLFDCYTTALEAADCSTSEGFLALSEDQIACSTGA